MSWTLLDPITTAIEKVLDLRTRQHAMTVTNLANGDTPGFRARHVDFGRSLSNLLRSGGVGGTGPTTSVDDAMEIELAQAPAWAADGNSVDPQREMAVLTENQMLYSASIEVLNRRVGLMRYVVTEGKG
jgi:flagellar basal-body rod protein FlgB